MFVLSSFTSTLPVLAAEPGRLRACRTPNSPMLQASSCCSHTAMGSRACSLFYQSYKEEGAGGLCLTHRLVHGARPQSMEWGGRGQGGAGVMPEPWGGLTSMASETHGQPKHELSSPGTSGCWLICRVCREACWFWGPTAAFRTEPGFPVWGLVSLPGAK